MQIKATGALVPHGSLPNLTKIKAPFSSDGMFVPASGSAFSLMVNTQLVKPAEYPKSWKEVLDPKWKGKILLMDPRAGSSGYVFFDVMNEKFGRGFHEALAAMKPEITTEHNVAQRRTARGEYALYLPLTISDYVNLKGMPVKAVMPEEGAPYITTGMALLKNAPNQNAARLFLNFLLDDETQTFYANNGNVSSIGLVSGSLPEDEMDIYKPKLLGTPDPDNFAASLKLAAEIYK